MHPASRPRKTATRRVLMEFEKAMQAATAYLTFTPRFMDPKQPQGL